MPIVSGVAIGEVLPEAREVWSVIFYGTIKSRAEPKSSSRIVSEYGCGDYVEICGRKSNWLQIYHGPNRFSWILGYDSCVKANMLEVLPDSEQVDYRRKQEAKRRAKLAKRRGKTKKNGAKVSKHWTGRDSPGFNLTPSQDIIVNVPTESDPRNHNTVFIPVQRQLKPAPDPLEQMQARKMAQLAERRRQELITKHKEQQEKQALADAKAREKKRILEKQQRLAIAKSKASQNLVDEDRDHWKRGTKISVWSSSKQQWFPGVIYKIMDDGSAAAKCHVQYKVAGGKLNQKIMVKQSKHMKERKSSKAQSSPQGSPKGSPPLIPHTSPTPEVVTHLPKPSPDANPNTSSADVSPLNLHGRATEGEKGSLEKLGSLIAEREVDPALAANIRQACAQWSKGHPQHSDLIKRIVRKLPAAPPPEPAQQPKPKRATKPVPKKEPAASTPPQATLASEPAPEPVPVKRSEPAPAKKAPVKKPAAKATGGAKAGRKAELAKKPWRVLTDDNGKSLPPLPTSCVEANDSDDSENAYVDATEAAPAKKKKKSSANHAPIPPPPMPSPGQLPVGWTEHMDKRTGRFYYHNKKDGITIWGREAVARGIIAKIPDKMHTY